MTIPSGPAKLAVYDVSGRVMSRREVGSLGAGRHVVSIGAPGTLAPGVYVVRLAQGDRKVRVALQTDARVGQDGEYLAPNFEHQYALTKRISLRGRRQRACSRGSTAGSPHTWRRARAWSAAFRTRRSPLMLPLSSRPSCSAPPISRLGCIDSVSPDKFCPLRFTVTPAGTGTGFFPTRDIRPNPQNTVQMTSPPTF